MRSRWSLRCAFAAVIVACSCLAATQARQAPADPPALTIRVWKERRELRLVAGDHVLKTCPVSLGREPNASKLRRGDGRTPQGTYYISQKLERSRFHRFLGISYPNIDDADRGYAERLISANEWADIFFANLQQTTPPWSTAMGGRVGIHGHGGPSLTPIDWTDGCVAVSDPDIDYLFERVPVGTPVIIE
jgi:murein L,D-transpeptidase YafK